MEKPSLEEVKEYFKNAETAKDWSGAKNTVNLEKLQITEQGDVVQDAFGKNWLVLYHYTKGYAKILTYKNTEPKFEITKEQILELSKDAHPSVVGQLKEWFPETFETVLEVGNWITYADFPNWLIRITEIDYDEKIVKGYGFGADGNWMQNTESETWDFKELETAIKADSDKVAEALNKETVKRYKKGDCVNGLYMKKEGFLSFEKTANDQGYIYVNNYFCVWMNVGNGMNDKVFENGIWASVVKTKTIQEAEKLLKELGHEFKIVQL